MVHSLFTIGPLVIPMLHCYLLLAHWIWYTTLFYWPTGYLYGSLSFPIGPQAISMVHYCLLLDQWLSLLYTALFYWPTGYLWVTLSSPIDTRVIFMVHYYLQLATGYLYGNYIFLLDHWLSLCYTAIFHWSAGYFYGTLPFNNWPIGYPYVTLPT